METPVVASARGMGHFAGLQRRLLPHSHCSDIQEVSKISPEQGQLPLYFPSLWSSNGPVGIHQSGQGGQTNGSSKGYQDPPVPRRLVATSPFPGNLPTAYPDPLGPMSRAGLAGKHAEVRAGAPTGFQLRRLPVRPFDRSGFTHSGPANQSKREASVHQSSELLYRSSVHVPDRSSDCDGKASLVRSAPYEANSVAPEASLACARTPGEGNSGSQVAPSSFENKTIINRDGLEVTDPKNILNEQANFFENLYTTRKIDSISNSKIKEKYLKNPSIPKLDQDVKSNLDLPINIDELSHALKNMKNDKSPGLDGFTTNFYKFFWTDLKNLLYETLTYSFQQGELPCGLRRGVLSLIPKKDKDLRYLKSWRPVSLLATDYKILAKALSIRLEQVMPSLISCDQVGYIKGRFIGENVRIIEDILSYTTTKHIPGLLILIDFEKAFDTVEWNFLFKSLKSYNIGSEFISWVKLLYNNITSCTVNNGHLSPSFKLSRGVRQGCPLSAFLFILVSEIISLSLKSDKGVKGIKIAGTEYKICQLADDTTIFFRKFKLS